jgi:hypothetical protein
MPATTVADRCLKSSKQPCNLHRQTLAVKWSYWRAQWLSTWHRHRIPPFPQVSSKISALLELPRSTLSAVIVKWKRLGATTSQPRSGRPHKLTERGKQVPAAMFKILVENLHRTVETVIAAKERPTPALSCWNMRWWCNNGPQDLIMVSLCIQIAIDKVQLCSLSVAYACPYHNPISTMNHSVHIILHLSHLADATTFTSENRSPTQRHTVHVVCGCEASWTYCQIL